MFEVLFKATDKDAWHLIRMLRGIYKPRIIFWKAVIDKTTTIKGDLTSMILKDTQEVDLAIQPVDAKGNAAQVDGVPAWASTDADIVAVAPAADGLSCVAKAGSKLGHAQITVTADADLGEGITPLTGIMEFDNVAGAAVALNVIAGEPREQA